VFLGQAAHLAVARVGADRGAFLLAEERRAFGEEVKRSGIDAQIWPSDLQGGSIPLAWECVMAVLSRGPDGPPTTNVGASPAPSGMFISCPIPQGGR
jgi:hypothetical protein